MFHVALQEERHDRASQASAAQQANSQKLKELNNLVKSTKRNDEKLREYRARKGGLPSWVRFDKNNDAASVFSESGPLPDSDEESDMEFTSFSVPDGSKPAPSGKVGRSKLPGGNKRPRTKQVSSGFPIEGKEDPSTGRAIAASFAIFGGGGWAGRNASATSPGGDFEEGQE